MASVLGSWTRKSLRTMTLEDCHGLLLIVLLRGGKRRETHLVHLRYGRAPSKEMLEDLHPAVPSCEMHRAVASAVHLVDVRLAINEYLDDGQLVVAHSVAKWRDALEVLRVHILPILHELLKPLQIAPARRIVQ